VVNVVGELQNEKNCCGIAQFPCDSTAFLSVGSSEHRRKEVSGPIVVVNSSNNMS